MNGSTGSDDTDFLAAEEPLEIRVEGHSVAIVMRTPGEDRELAAGFLVTEGLVHAAGDITDIKCGSENIIDVRLLKPEAMDLKKLTRHVFTSSSCGICSKASIDAVRQQFPRIEAVCEVEPQVLLGLPHALAASQETFKFTGGLHACALFDLTGKLLALREDVGRHNALDKIAGWALLENRLPLREHILLLSGRASFEMMQKALAAGVPIVAAISAPSSLAAEFAQESGQTLVGFLRGERMNIYAGASRVRAHSE
jgi:FdhD protein